MRIERQSFYPSSESVKSIEHAAQQLSPQDSSLQEWHNAYASLHTLRIASDLDIVKKEVNKSGSILEFGSVPLLFTAALHQNDYNVIGCDIAPERYAETISSLGVSVVKCDIETERLPFDDNSFDAVVFNELFEHLRINPIFTLSEVHRVMKPGATLMLSSPNLRSLDGIVNFLFKNRAYSCSGNIYDEYAKLEKLGHMGHVREYTTKEVVEFLQQIGFSVSSITFRGQLSSRMEQTLQRLFPRLSPFVSYIAKKANSTNTT